MSQALPKSFLAACEDIANRLRVFKRVALQARERGDEQVELHVAEIWEAGDEAALEAFEKALAELTGQRPLPFQEAS